MTVAVLTVLMMEDFSSEISLNLVDPNSTNFGRGPTRKRKKNYGDKATRIDLRKQARLESERVKDVSSESAESNVGLKRKKQSDEIEGNTGGKEFLKKKKGDSIISSLYRKNPEIPNVIKSEVETITEKVFTGKTFKDLPIHPYLVSNLEEKQGFQEMTEIQRHAIPILLRGKDALVKSQTGSGKTLSYAVPIVQSLQSRKIKVQRSDGPYAVVIVPTREVKNISIL